jgi:hypothetical protein
MNRLAIVRKVSSFIVKSLLDLFQIHPFVGRSVSLGLSVSRRGPFTGDK